MATSTSDSPNPWRWLVELHRRRPIAVLLGLVIVLSSVNLASAARPEDPHAFRDLIDAGPQAALRWQGDRVVPRPQATAERDELVGWFADFLNMGRKDGYITVSEDFTSVTVTDEARRKVAEGVERDSGGCDSVKRLSASWIGFQLELTSDCTQHERIGRRADLDRFNDQAPQGSVPTANHVMAAGFAPTRPGSASNMDAAFQPSIDWDCVLSWVGVGLGTASLLVLLWGPWLGPLYLFWISIFIGAASTGLAFVSVAMNCTQVSRVEVQGQAWVSQNAMTLPLAFIGGGGSIQDDPIHAYWITAREACRFGYYYNYKPSGYGYNVPASVRWNC